VRINDVEQGTVANNHHIDAKSMTFLPSTLEIMINGVLFAEANNHIHGPCQSIARDLCCPAFNKKEA